MLAGTRLGPYEILSPIGAGGMGEVYRARDTRLDRQVAVKILPDEFAQDARFKMRFEREARAVSRLSHPNICAVYDVGDNYLVMELLEGETLRAKLGAEPGPSFPIRKAIEYSLQMAHGLAAAHDKGIIHRDLKPENVFITSDGRVKILDFGLAKVSMVSEDTETEARATNPGMVVGTVGYMSPEQARGQSVDHRSDLFAFGAILYETISGTRAFHGKTTADTISAILHEDPPELSGTILQITPGLERIVRHCLEKNPEERFQSARDLAFDLESISSISGAAQPAAPIESRRRRHWLAAAIAVVFITGAAIGWFGGTRLNRRAPLQFHRLTFRSATIAAARFVPGQASVVYSETSGGSADLFITTPGRPEMRSLGMPATILLSVSRSGEMAILTNAHYAGWIATGTLARVPLNGGAPRELVVDVHWADWTPEGDDLLVVRTVGGVDQVELPLGKIVYTSVGWISSPRLSRDGESIAFIDHPASGGDSGLVVLLGPDRKKHVLTHKFNGIQGLAWSASGKEIWFTASEQGNDRVLYAVTPAGRQRLIATAPEALTLMDVAADGRILIAQSSNRCALFGRGANDSSDRDLSWFDLSFVDDVSPDGSAILFDETGEGGGKNFSVYVRSFDGTPPIRLGDGWGMRFSPDGHTVLARRTTAEHLPTQLYSYPIGPGEVHQLTHDNINHLSAAWLPDGQHIAFVGYEPNHRSRIFVQDLSGGQPHPITPEGIGGNLLVSGDGKSVSARTTDGVFTIFPIAGGRPVAVPEVKPTERAMEFDSAEGSLLYYPAGGSPTPIFKLELARSRSELWREVPTMTSASGVTIHFSRDHRAYAYSRLRETNDLYLLDGAE